MGLSFGFTSLAGALGILFGTMFVAFHASQGAELGLPQMIQSRAQFGFRGVVVVLIGTLFTFIGFNVADSRAHARRTERDSRLERAAVTLIIAAAARAARGLRARLAASHLSLVLLAVSAPVHPADACDRAGTGAGDASVARWLQLGGVHRTVRRERGLQHHLCPVGVGLFALLAARDPAASHHRRGVSWAHLRGDLAHFAGCVAGDAARRLRRAGRASRCGKRTLPRLRRFDGARLGDGAGRHDGAQCIQRHAHRGHGAEFAVRTASRPRGCG